MFTEKQIEAMTSGRELDTAIAELVMRQNVSQGFLDDALPVTFSELTAHYSTDIRAALDVQTEMHRRGYWMSLRSSFDKDGGKFSDGWFCGFTPHLTTGWNGKPDNNTHGDTAPLAICRAALKTISEFTRPNNPMQATSLRSASGSA